MNARPLTAFLVPILAHPVIAASDWQAGYARLLKKYDWSLNEARFRAMREPKRPSISQ
jgi:hypothetical protein